jgi:hypothetical protein
MLEPIPFAGMVEIDESFDRTASHMTGEYVTYKELTDEEIALVAKDFFLSQYVPYKFARAILKKASEK